MPLFQRLLNYDVEINKLTEPPVIINNVVNATEDDREAIRELIMTRYSGDMISLLPSCRCGETKGEFSLGVRCPECNTLVESSIENDIQSALWFQRPQGVAPLMNPIIWIMLKNRLKKSGYSILQWITDRGYRPQTKIPNILRKFEDANIPRGYNNFVYNFDEIMKFVFSIKEFQVKKGEHDYLQEILFVHRDCVFSDFIPLPNKSLFIVEKTNVAIFLDDVTRNAIDFLLLLVSIDNSFHDQSIAVKENRTAKALAKYGDFLEDYYKQNLSPKQGQFRRHIYGSRTIFSFRAVISSITDPHQYDQIEVPWGIGVTAFRPHLINKLEKYGFDLNSAVGMLMTHVGKYHALLDKFLKELIEESKDSRGISVILQRNPSLLQGSALRMFISKFKTDTADKTVGVPILVTRSMNADFDGDALNISISLDNKMAELWYPLAPEFNVFQLDRPFKVSNNLGYPKPVCSAISAFLDDDED